MEGHESTRVIQEAEGVGEMWTRGLSMVAFGRDNLDRQAGLGWASLDNSNALWGLGTD